MEKMMQFWNEIKKQNIKDAKELMQLLNDSLFLQTEEGEALVKALAESFEKNVK